LIASAEALLAPRSEQRILPGLERMQRALDALGHPERGFASVLVLGTNGKGSTAALLASILQAHNERVGLYTSPHLVAVEERIRVDGARITGMRMSELVRGLNRFPDLSYFETLTCAALVEFAERGVRVAVLEAGLGGRWDAVNAVDPVLSLLTNAGTDHQAWLGGTRAAIAAEKAAALRGHEGIIGAWDPEVEGAIRANADPTTPLSLAPQWAKLAEASGPGSGVRPSRRPRRRSLGVAPIRAPGVPEHLAQFVRYTIGDLVGEARLPLAGAHQLANLLLALAGAAALARHGVIGPLGAAEIATGIERVDWPGRLQWLQWHGKALLLDGAHNLEAMRALAFSLDQLGLSGKVHLLFSCLADKPLAEMAALLRPRVGGVTVAPIASPRATPVEALGAHFPGCATAGSVGEALATLPSDRPTLVTGSLRLVGEVLAEVGGDHD
ncbi:MAG: bifunctional folylpolyglutamate synthase/dihydrofolate synthase, partial [Thermoanaerobaculales bacterium]